MEFADKALDKLMCTPLKERLERQKIRISRITSLKIKLMVIRPSRLEKLCKVRGDSSAAMSLE